MDSLRPLDTCLRVTLMPRLTVGNHTSGSRTVKDALRILIVHNEYATKGGEDLSVASEASLLREHGHEVDLVAAQNTAIRGRGATMVAALATTWNPRAAKMVKGFAQQVSVVHLHNTFPLLSPAAVRAASTGTAAVVHTLRNYRPLCAAATLWRDGSLCMDCVRGIPAGAVMHACYRDSRAASAAVAVSQSVHRAIGTYKRSVDTYIVLSESMRRVYLNAGWNDVNLVVKPNHIDEPSAPRVANTRTRPYVLYAGRLTDEKGVRLLLDAWTECNFDLLIIGKGPLEPLVAEYAKCHATIRFAGQRSHNDVLDAMHQAAAVVVPSLWQEPFGRVVAEAFACGVPVVASSVGGPSEMVTSGVNGMVFATGDAAGLRNAVTFVCDVARAGTLRAGARAAYEATYSPESNYETLMSIYAEAMRRREIRLAEAYNK